MNDSSFRDERVGQLGSRAERRKILREIVNEERNELGLAPLSLDAEQEKFKAQSSHALRLARPRSVGTVKKHTNFLRAPRSLRGKGMGSPDDLFRPDEGQRDFWLYDSHKVTQSTLGPLINNLEVPAAEIYKSALCQTIKKKVDNLVAQATTRKRCGIIFDLISTSKIINSSIPHHVGNFIYEHIETNHFDKTMIKFTFVGITDNVNCCAARDVFCRDELLRGRYIGDTKRTFDALDNVHMFTVFPGGSSIHQGMSSGKRKSTTPIPSSIHRNSLPPVPQSRSRLSSISGSPPRRAATPSGTGGGGSTFLTQGSF